MKKADPVLNYEEFPHLCYDVVKIEKRHDKGAVVVVCDPDLCQGLTQ